MRVSDMTDVFHKRLGMVQLHRRNLLSRDTDIEDVYRVACSFRRGSTSQATDRGLPPDVVDANNRWRKFERAESMQPTLSMREHYTDVELSLNQLLRYSMEM